MSCPDFPSVTLGDPDKEVLVFLSGFPDDQFSSFSPVFEELKKDYFLISLCLPGLETNSTTRRKWGYNFNELLPALNNTITKLSPKQKVTLVIHDWGNVLIFFCLCLFFICRVFRWFTV